MTDTQTPGRPNTVPGGQTDDPGASALQEGEFGLDGDLRATMLAALEDRWNADDPGSTTLDNDDSPADTDAKPAPATQSPPTGEDGAGAGEGAAPVDPDPGTPPAADAPPDADTQFNLDSYAEQYFGTRLNPQQARELFAVLGGLQSLSPEQRAQVDQIVAGGASHQYPVTQGQPVQQQAPVTQPAIGTPTGQPTPPATSPASSYALPPRPGDDDYEGQRLYDQYIAPLAQATQSQLADIQANIAQTTRVQQEQEQARIAAQIESAATTWRAQYPIISDGEYDALTDRIARSGVFPATISAHRGDVQAATNAILEQHFWADPTLRDRAIANIASGRKAGDQSTLDPTSPVARETANADTHRQARAGSVAGGGGSTTPRGQAPTPADAAGRKAALISEIAAQGDFS